MIKNSQINNLNLICFLLIIYAYINSVLTGISWDELFVVARGEERLKYLYSLGNAKITNDGNQYFPGLFDTLAVFFTQLFPKQFTISTLHLFNTTFSLLTLLGIYRLTKILFNKPIARISTLITYFNPIFFGHMAINSKDTIITFSFVWLLLTFLRYLKTQKDFSKRKRLVIYACVFLSLGIGTRIQFLGLLIFFTPFLFINNKIKSENFTYKSFLCDFLIIFFVSYFFMISTWPHVHSNIFVEPFKYIIESFDIKNGPPKFLFDGKIIDPGNVPYNYFFINLLYRSPEFVILLYITFVLIIIKDYSFYKDNFNDFNLIILISLLIVIFPSILIILINLITFDGIRYFLFIIPFYSLIPSVTIYYLYKNYNNKISKISLALISVLIIFYISIFLRINPYQYSYVNSFLTNDKTIENKFENDYWGISLKEMVSKINKYKEIDFSQKKLVGLCGYYHENFLIELNKYPKLNIELAGIYDQQKTLDYVITNNRGMYIKRDGDNPKYYMNCNEYYDGQTLIEINTDKVSLSRLKIVNYD